MKKLLIAIPSKNRVGILKENTWRWALYLTYKYDVRIFVEPQDFEKYNEAFPDAMIIVLPENDKGLGYAKKHIQEYAKQFNYDIIFKLDDDTKGFTNYREKLSDEEMPAFIIQTLEEVLKGFENENLGAVAFPYSFHLFDKTKWEKVKKVQSSYLVRTELLCPPGKFNVFEDFAVGLNCLVKNYKVMKYGLMSQELGVKVGGGTGGHQEFDRYEQALLEAEELRKLYPPITFKRVDKPWKIEPDMKSIKL